MKEAYGRIWRYIRPYRFRLVVGLVCGFLTAGTLVPMFQLIQPATKSIEQRIVEVEEDPAGEEAKAEPADSGNAAQMPKWYGKAQKYAAKLGLELVDEKGALTGGLLALVLTVVPILAGLRLLLKFLNLYFLSYVGNYAIADLVCDLLRHTQRQSLQFFSRVDMGRLMSRIMGDSQQVMTVVKTVIVDFAEAPFEILVSGGYVVYFAVKNDMVPTLILILIAFPLFTIPISMLAKKIREYSQETMARASVVFSRLHEVVTCIGLVKSFNTERFEWNNYREANTRMVKIQLRNARIGGMVGPTLEITGVLIICGFVCWCFVQHITLDQVLPMLAPLLVMYKPLKKVSNIQVALENSMASLCRIFSLQDMHDELPEKADAVRKTTFDRDIRFENVTFRYATADRDAVSGASFTIEKGKKVAVVGGTGSGKSTMSYLLARFADPSSGRITIDGIDLRDIAIDDLRRMVGVITQEPLLFNDTIAYNLRYGTPDADEESVRKAARLANAEDFILSQPEGYGRVVGEKGMALSGGEKQRVSIAAAILKNPPILILDEATSALDNVTEAQVQEALEKLMENRTTFVIAHRLSTVQNADLILVMDSGRIVESGTHDVLYAKNGYYRHLCDIQER